ncbi:uncharacterized protein LOC108834988 isoform X2 [Raphanus sativus]|uniref:Uncharacterized protein LOC108834988 isoform X2 n=1 Tax=Raphanus sativus TaxID=3726 RepID=A0A9W3CAI0_RAPSA|nr:uncharacterized protein LOC108834988 isoform X2 [Raphanus sativus]
MSTTAMVPILKGMIFEISLQKLQGNGQGFQRSQLHQADNPKKKFGLNKDHTGNGNNKRMSTELDDADHMFGPIHQKKFSNGGEHGVRTIQLSPMLKRLQP